MTQRQSAAIVNANLLADDNSAAKGFGCCVTDCLLGLRAMVLYSLFPHDKTFWAAIRNPLW
jgi:hypothetical protein